jgi:serine protease DegQ
MRKFWSLFSQTVTVLLAVYFVVATLKPEWLNRTARTTSGHGVVSLLESVSASSTAAPTPAPGSLAAAAKRASAAVVSINTSKNVRANPKSSDPWFKFFFGDQAPNNPGNGAGNGSGNGRGQPNQQEQMGLGSGVIVSSDGYILTNNHVVEGADEIEVILNDSRRAIAKVIGTDPESDLAVLKISLDKLPVITLGNSDQALVGDTVLAIGNPFGVGQTVTSGIVSALGRNHLGINTFENFIQTDAAINPGNSGGALVDMNGNLLGINTAIYSRSGGSLGIGFAIPVSLAKQVLQDIVKDGAVTRAWIGVEPQDLTPEIAEALKIKPLSNNEDLSGVVITGVMQGGPADKGGIKAGDILVRVAGKVVGNTVQAIAVIAGQKPGTPVVIQVLRTGKTVDLSVTPRTRPKPKMKQ